MEKNNSEASQLVTIPKKFLLAVYLILPILFAIFIVDVFYFDSALLPYMGLTTLTLPLYLIIFELPHIMASFFGFFDDEYVSHYKKQLFVYLPIILLATLILLFVNYKLGFALYIVGTVWHGLKQQTGIALILGARPTLVHTIWTFVPIIITSMAHAFYILPDIFPPAVVPLISPIILFGIIALIFITIWRMWESDPKVRLYIFAVSSLFFVGYIFLLSKYIFLAFFAIRFVHDVTAFSFYMTHDHNRNKEDRKNWLYKITAAVPLPVLLMVPALAILFSYLARVTTNGLEIGFSILVLLSMAHYYLESVMWKRDTPHRQHVKVS